MSDAPSAVATLEADELAGAAGRAIAELPERRRDVFVLAHLHGLSYKEVAETLGITPRTVANHMSLALAQLREALAVHPGRRGEGSRVLPFPPVRRLGAPVAEEGGSDPPLGAPSSEEGRSRGARRRDAAREPPGSHRGFRAAFVFRHRVFPAGRAIGTIRPSPRMPTERAPGRVPT